jgi:hypothetical protein
MVLTVAVYGVVLAIVFYAGAGSKWAEITTAYFAIANLLVLWWYAHNTRQQVEVGLQQYELAFRQRRETNKPFVVIERVTDLRAGNAHYAIRNIGPGVAVNVFHVVHKPGSVSKIRRAGVPRFESLGALAPGAQRVLPETLEQPLRDAKGESHGAVLVAEGIATRTARWSCTLNALAPSGEVLHRIQPLAVQDENIEISNVLDGAWAEIGFAQLELQEDAKRHS